MPEPRPAQTKHLARRAAIALAVILLAIGCTAVVASRIDRDYGEPKVRNRIVASTGSEPEYHRDIQPILDARCVVCHACYDAPCQLKLSSFTGVERGASGDIVYSANRLHAAPPTRLFVDAGSTEAWRAKGFFPVLNERAQTTAAQRDASTLYRMLELKRRHPLPKVDVLPAVFDFSLSRSQQCSDADHFDAFAADHPLWGMPFGLPGLSEEHFSTLERWIDQGARATPLPPLADEAAARIQKWERFWNGRSPKERLVTRYMYEHLFLAHLYFADLGAEQTYRLVRSTTPPGEPISEIATRRPFDFPGESPFYYRLRRSVETPVDKTRMPYALSDARMARWQELFFEAEYAVDELPGYDPEVAANPFAVFRALPVGARYRFMLDEAQFTIMGFIKGPVCRGQVALNVINDHFWVVFANPDAAVFDHLGEEISRETPYADLPAESNSNAVPLASWLRYSREHKKLLEARSAYLSETFPQGRHLDLELIWDGDGRNRNAALTVFRHFDAATVVRGFVGGEPKTAWLIGYSQLERIHYLLVAGFDVFGNVGHQLDTRMYMDFLRMESEMDFVALLPEDVAERELLSWYRDAEDSVKAYVDALRAIGNERSAIAFETDDPKQELYDLIRARLGEDVVPIDPLGSTGVAVEAGVHSITRTEALRRLAQLEGEALAFLPEQSILQIGRGWGEDAVFTLLLNRAHSNVSSLFKEKKRLVPAGYGLSVVPGVLGSHPNAFFRMEEAEIEDFTRAVASLASEADYRALLDRHGIRRTDGGFWAFSDSLNAWHMNHAPIGAGWLDYNRFENR